MIRSLLLVIVTVVLLASPVGGSAWAAEAVDAPVDAEAEGPDEAQGSGACEALPWAVGQVCDGVGDALAFGAQPLVAGGIEAALNEMVGFVVDGAAWLLEQVASFLDTSTRPQLTSGWFGRAYQDMTAVAVFGLLPFLLLAIVHALIRQDLSMLVRATLGYVPLAAIGTAAAVVVVDMLVQLTDLLSAWVGRSLGTDLHDFSTGLGEAMASWPAGSGGPVAGMAALLAAGLIAFAAFVIWLELLLRQAAIYVAVLFLPLGFMAMVWPATAHWLRRLVQGLIAIILSKFVIVAVMALAASALNTQTPQVGEPAEGGFGLVLAGGSMLLLAALAPYVLLRLIPVFEAGLSGDLEGTYRRPTAAVAPTTGSHMLHAVQQRGGGRPAGGAHLPAAGADEAGGAEAASSAGGPADGSAAARTSVADGSNGTPGTTDDAAPTGDAGTGAPVPVDQGGTASGAGDTPSSVTGGSSAGSEAAASSGSGAASSGAAGGASGEGAGTAAGGTAPAGAAGAGVGTVAAGALGAKRVGGHLQQHGSEQHDATTGDEPAGSGSGPADAPPPRPVPTGSPASDPGPGSAAEPVRTPPGSAAPASEPPEAARVPPGPPPRPGDDADERTGRES